MPISFVNKLKFTPKPEVRLDEFQFDGGLITDIHETKLKSNQSPNLQNVVFDESGSIKTRGGYIKYNASAMAEPVSGLIRYYGSDGISQLLAKSGDALFLGDDVAGTFTEITLGSGVSLDQSLDWTVSNGTLLVVDGSNYIQKYRGSTKSNYSTGTISVTNGSEVVTGSGTTWTGNTEVGEYIKLPNNKWYKITNVTGNTTLSVEVEYQGSTVSGQTYIVSPWGEVQGKLNSALTPGTLVRPAPISIQNHYNRIWTLEDNTLRFSALDTSVDEENFNDFDSSNNAGQINIPSTKGAKGVGIYSFNDSLYVFQQRAIWRVVGTAPSNFELRNISNEVGLLARASLVEWNNLLIFLSDQGIVAFDGTNIRNISQYKINSLIDSWANKTSVAAVLWDNKYMLSYTPTADANNNEAIFCDLVQGEIGASLGLSIGTRWGKFTNIPANVFSAWIGGSDSGEIYFGSSAAGYVYKWGTGTTDDGTDITTIYDTPSIGFQKNVDDKTLKKFYLQQVQTGDWDMTARLYTDINQGPTSVTINLSPGSVSNWAQSTTNELVWDQGSWSSEGEILTTRVSEFQGLAKYFKFRFEATDPVEILGLTVTERARRI